MNSIDQVEISGKRVLMRVDFNVPVDADGNVTDTTRIKAHLRTIRYCMEKGSKLVLISHMGRPKGQRVEKLTLRPCAAILSDLLGKEVPFVDDCVGDKALAAVNAMKPGDVILLENLRFHIGDEKNDPEFARQLAELADVYIDDAFAVAHRKAASNSAITEAVKSCAAGFLLRTRSIISIKP